MTNDSSSSSASVLGIVGKALLIVGIPAVTVWGFMVPPAEGFMQPDLARMLFFHLPCALGSSIFLMLAPYFALRNLRSKDHADGVAWDIRTVAATEIALVTGILTLVTGSLFSKVQWGEWWNWDPRQTSFLLVMLIVAAYFALRGALPDAERKAHNSGAYLLAAVLPIMFLIFVYPRLPQVATLHPNLLQKGGGLDANYRNVFLSTFVLVTGVTAWIYQLRVRAGLYELELELQNAELADRDRPAATGMVRPVSLPSDGG